MNLSRFWTNLPEPTLPPKSCHVIGVLAAGGSVVGPCVGLVRRKSLSLRPITPCRQLRVEGSVAPEETTNTPSWESKCLDICHWDRICDQAEIRAEIRANRKGQDLSSTIWGWSHKGRAVWTTKEARLLSLGKGERRVLCSLPPLCPTAEGWEMWIFHICWGVGWSVKEHLLLSLQTLEPSCWVEVEGRVLTLKW